MILWIIVAIFGVALVLLGLGLAYVSIRWQPRTVRCHQNDPAPPVEGILVRRPKGPWLVLRQAGVVQSPGSTVALDAAQEVWVPRDKVIMVEVNS